MSDLLIDRFSARLGKPRPELTSDCLRRLRAYHWPGNVRELENVIERAVIIARDGKLSLRSVLPIDSFQPTRESRGSHAGRKVRTKRELREVERETLVEALERSDWKVAGPNGAARALGVPPSTLASRMRALQILRPARNTSNIRESRTAVRETETSETSLANNSPTVHATV